MSIIENIFNGSYKGFPITITGSSSTGGRKTSIKSYPNRDDQQIEDLGLQPRGFVLKIVVHAKRFEGGVATPADYFKARDALLAVLDSGGEGELVHPYYGKFTGFSVLTWSLDEEDSKLGEGNLTVEFAPNTGVSVPDTTGLTFSAVIKASGVMGTTQKGSFADRFGINNNNFGNPIKAIRKLNSMVTSIRSSISFVEDIKDDVNAFSKELNEFSNNITSLLDSPVELATSIDNLFISMTNLSNSPALLFGIFEDLFGFGEDDTLLSFDTTGNDSDTETANTTFNSTPTQLERVQNNSALNSIVNTNAISKAYNMAAQIEFTTVEEIDDISARLDTEYERMITSKTLTDDVKISLEETRVVITNYFNDQRILAAELINVYVQTTSSRLASYTYYGVSTRGDEISEQNNITDIDFVKGNIQILSE